MTQGQGRLVLPFFPLPLLNPQSDKPGGAGRKAPQYHDLAPIEFFSLLSANSLCLIRLSDVLGIYGSIWPVLITLAVKTTLYRLPSIRVDTKIDHPIQHAP